MSGTTGASSIVQITTTSKYSVIGYGGVAERGWTMLLALVMAGLLWMSRRRACTLVRAGMVMVLLAFATLATSGCSGKLPAQNGVYTAAGDYTFTISASDGIITHSTTYALHVTTN